MLTCGNGNYVLLLSELSTVLRQLWPSSGFMEWCISRLWFECLPWAVDSKSRAYVFARITLFLLKIALVVVELSSYNDKILTDGRTDIHGAFR